MLAEVLLFRWVVKQEHRNPARVTREVGGYPTG